MSTTSRLRLASRFGVRLCQSSGLAPNLVTPTLLPTSLPSAFNSTLVRNLRWSAAGGSHGPSQPSNGPRSRGLGTKETSFSSASLDNGQDVMDIIEQEQDEKTKETISKVNEQIEGSSYGRLFAVVQMEWHQHKITAGDLLMLNYDVGAPNGTRIRLEKALLVGSKDFTLIGRPLLPRDLFRITATVVEKSLSHTKVTFQLKRKERFRKRSYRFERAYNTTLRINSIDLLKPVDQTLDRTGFEPLQNQNPLTLLDAKR